MNRACDAFETGQFAAYGYTPASAAAAIVTVLAEIAASSTDTPQGLHLRATLLRVAALPTAPHIEAYKSAASTWVSSANALL